MLSLSTVRDSMSICSSNLEWPSHTLIGRKLKMNQNRL